MQKDNNNLGVPNEVINGIVESHKEENGKLGKKKFGAEYVEPGDNSRIVADVLYARSLPKIDTSDDKQVEQRITDYFKYCIEHDRKPSMLGVANWLGVSRMTVNYWKRGVFRQDGRHKEIIESTISALEEMWLDYMMEGKMYPANGIFIAKNLFGYKDVQDVVVTPNNPMGEIENPEDLQKRIEESVVIDTDGEEIEDEN